MSYSDDYSSGYDAGFDDAKNESYDNGFSDGATFEANKTEELIEEAIGKVEIDMKRTMEYELEKLRDAYQNIIHKLNDKLIEQNKDIYDLRKENATITRIIR